jgi:Fe-S oxidoreductase
MGLLEEPRYVLKSVVNHFHEMPEDTIREKTFCCGSGTGLNASEDMELRMKGGFPRANAVKFVAEHYGVNMLANVCAIDRATLKALMEYWVPSVNVCGLHELVANALIMKGEKPRETNLRGEPLPAKAQKEVKA